MIERIVKKIRGYYVSSYERLIACLREDGIIFGSWHFSLMAVLWGVWILSPWGGFGATPGYEPLTLLASEFTFGSLAVIMGVANMHFVLTNKKISLSIFSMLLGYFWSLIGISFLVGNLASAGGVVYLMIALFNFWVYKRFHG